MKTLMMIAAMMLTGSLAHAGKADIVCETAGSSASLNHGIVRLTLNERSDLVGTGIDGFFTAPLTCSNTPDAILCAGIWMRDTSNPVKLRISRVNGQLQVTITRPKIYQGGLLTYPCRVQN